MALMADPDATAAPAACKLRVLPAPALRGILLGAVDPQALFCLGTQPRRLVERLCTYSDRARAVRFLARALPGREAVWWACRCVSASLPAGATADEQAAIQAAEAWVWQPVPDRAALAIAAGQSCGRRPGAWPGLAIAWSLRLRLPDAGFARGVEGAVLRAARRDLPPGSGSTHEAARQDRFIQSALEIAAGAAGRIPADGAELPPALADAPA